MPTIHTGPKVMGSPEELALIELDLEQVWGRTARLGLGRAAAP
jgi:hypothetical protein